MKGYFRKRGEKWSFTLDLGKDPVTGKRKQKTSSGFKTKKEAQIAVAELISQLEKGMYVSEPKETFAEFLLEWNEKHSKPNIQHSTYVTNSYYINKHILPILGNVQLKKLKPQHISDFYEQKRLEGYKTNTINRIHTIVRKSLEHAYRWQKISRNIMEFIEAPRTEIVEFSTWSIEEVQKFLSTVKQDRLYISYVIAIYTGMRKGEVLGLRWQDIDFKRQKISIKQTLNKLEGEFIFGNPKTKGSKRQISVPDIVIKALKEHKARQNEEKLAYGDTFNAHDLVICTSVGTPVCPRNLLRHFKTYIKKADVPNIRFHDLRHTHATIMLQIGEHPKIVAERLGHSKITTLLDIYSHVLPDMQERSADNFSKALELKQKKI